MRIIPFLASLLTTLALVVALDRPWGSVPPLGKLLSPQHGFWRNAEAIDQDYSENISIPGLKGQATVYLDDRLVPHVFANNESDLYYIQGYLHAKFRLWQMEFQVYAAAGRISELIGSKALNYDRDKRRLGMVYAAEKSLEQVEKDSTAKAVCDAYTAGVNAYLETLKVSDLPVEYKLLNYQPEKWSNLKTALFLKYMSFDLAGGENDIEYTNAKTIFGLSDFEKMYPYGQDSLDPVVPKAASYPAPGIDLKPPASADSLYLGAADSADVVSPKPNPDNGSNNWAVSGKKTQSGAPILCNDPHLGLNLPSLWFEMQLSGPSSNSYGVSFPGSPCVIIGFNDSCAFGFTNATRDVRDYYDIQFKDASMQEYWYNGQWTQTQFRYERIGVKGEPDFVDTVAYTVFGPVMYDRHFRGEKRADGKHYYAVRWKAHDPSDELMVFYKLNHARNYNDYYEAIQYFHTPGQNCIFASKSGDIAIWDQGEFPAKWRRQGDFILPGTDSSYQWRGNIPQGENPHQINPERQFVSSANQYPADPKTYPYYLGGRYEEYRGYIINRYLQAMNSITPQDMMKLQTENYNVFAEMALPILFRNIDSAVLSTEEKGYLEALRKWNLRDDVDEKGATIFQLLWENFTKEVWGDEFSGKKLPLIYPSESTLLEGILRDSAFKFLDKINTPELETLKDDATAAFRKTAVDCAKVESEGRLAWGKYKSTGVYHLAKLEPFSRTGLLTGGGRNCINATSENHGPSWRMVVQLSEKTEAFGIFPGGQSGNPGSPYYENTIEDWAGGKYYPLWVMTPQESSDKRVKATLTFSGK